MDKLWSEVAAILSFPFDGEDFMVSDLQMDSRLVQAGDVFVAVQGQGGHGMQYLEDAVNQGAVAVLTDRKMAQCPLPLLVVDDLAEQLGDLAHHFYNQPSKQVKVLAVTGTNGKTSVAWFLMHGLNAMGHQAAYIGTLGTGFADQLEAGSNTTPSVIKLHQLMRQLADQGATHVCMEASSHGLHQGRLNGLVIHHAMFTQLSRDHLDYHKNMAAYGAAKKMLFTKFESQLAIINGDDVCGQAWLADTLSSQATQSYGFNEGFDWVARSIEPHREGLAFVVHHQGNQVTINSPLMGLFNVENLLLVMASMHALGSTLTHLQSIIRQLPGVPGRMEVIVDNDKRLTWVVDYAHTPDALDSVLKSVRHHVSGRLWCVFGCGGDRDAGKRALMGRAAWRASDEVIITSDNPRTEDPQSIVDDVLEGIEQPVRVELDRKKAIQMVRALSDSGDVVVVAGKGHETYQEINGVRHPFSDTQVIQDLMEVAA